MVNAEKSCKNCKHFYQHYGWSANNFIPINCGHCTKRKLFKKDYARFPFKNGCSEWEYIETKIAIQQESIKHLLTRMANQINEIIMLIDSGKLNL